MCIVSSVTSIGNYAFEYCNGLEDVKIGKSVTSIGNRAFEDCSNLEKIYYNGTANEWNEIVISLDNSELTNAALYYYSATDPKENSNYWHYDANGNVAEWPKHEHNYANGFCVDCGKKEMEEATGLEYELSEDGNYYIVSGIGNETRKKFIIPSTYLGKPVKEIGDYAFCDCGALTSIIISDSVTSIGEDAFAYCNGLEDVKIGKNVTSIGEDAFFDCDALTSIIIPDSVTSIGEDAFLSCNGLEDVKIGKNVTSIGNYAFSACGALTSIIIPDSVTSIGDYAFCDCLGLTNVTIGNKVTTIGAATFYYCSSLTSITIPDSVKTIDYGAFESCYHVKTVTIGSGVTSINNAFAICWEISKVYYKGTVDDWNKVNVYPIYGNPLTNATRYYYSEAKPKEGDYYYYWHYDENGNVVEW